MTKDRLAALQAVSKLRNRRNAQKIGMKLLYTHNRVLIQKLRENEGQVSIVELFHSFYYEKCCKYDVCGEF